MIALLLLSGPAVADRQVSGRLDLVPFGTLRTKEADMQTIKVDTDTAIGIGASIEFPIARQFSIGFSPRYLFKVKGETFRDSGSQLDLAVRAKFEFPVNPRTKLFAFLSPGYSLARVPDGSVFAGLDPAGLILGIGGGADIMISRRAFITLELGYTWGFQGASEDGFKYTYATNLAHLGLGIGSRF
ncbi:MAG: outer membrane beta-barrel protein [Kofleriaceae bacterium]